MSYAKAPVGGTSVNAKTDGITLTGDGTDPLPIEILQVQTDATITGDGTVASPLSAVGGGGSSFPEWSQISYVSGIPPLSVPFLAYPTTMLSMWDEDGTFSNFVDYTTDYIRFQETGKYRVSMQQTWRTDPAKGKTEFNMIMGLSETQVPAPSPVMQGAMYAHFEAGEWKDTITCEFVITVKNIGDIYYPFVQTDGDPCDIELVGEFSTVYYIEKVAN
jgi:hypothetical protein